MKQWVSECWSLVKFRERGCLILRKDLYVLKDSRNGGFSGKLLKTDEPTCDLFCSDAL